jgi:kumamolisin
LALLGNVPALEKIPLAIGLPLRNQDKFQNLIKEIYDPKSTNYGQYLSRSKFSDLFAPTQSDYKKLIDFVESNGFIVTKTHPTNNLLDVVGTAENIKNTFHVNLIQQSRWQHKVYRIRVPGRF